MSQVKIDLDLSPPKDGTAVVITFLEDTDCDLFCRIAQEAGFCLNVQRNGGTTTIGSLTSRYVTKVAEGEIGALRVPEKGCRITVAVYRIYGASVVWLKKGAYSDEVAKILYTFNKELNND